MRENTHHRQDRQTCNCYACGHNPPVNATRPFGFHADGTVATRVCLACMDDEAKAVVFALVHEDANGDSARLQALYKLIKGLREEHTRALYSSMRRVTPFQTSWLDVLYDLLERLEEDSAQ